MGRGYEPLSTEDWNKLMRSNVVARVFPKGMAVPGLGGQEFGEEAVPSPTPTPSITPTQTITPTPTITPTITPTSTLTPTPTPSALPSGTTEANAYLSAIVEEGGTIDETISAATRTLFTSLVSNGLYNKMLVMYPLLGGTANSASINAVNVGTYDINWAGGMSFTITGATGNGTNAFGNTGINFNTGSPLLGDNYFFSGTFGVQIHSLPGGVGTPIGAGPGSSQSRYMMFGGSEDLNVDWGSNLNPGGYSRITIEAPTASKGLYIMNSTGPGSGTQTRMFKNGVNIANGGTAIRTNYPDVLYLFRREDGFYYDGTESFAFVASYMTNDEVITLSTIINTYQTSLGRNLY